MDRNRPRRDVDTAEPAGLGPVDDGVVRIDTHVHTDASYDANVPLESVLERAAAVGLDGVVVTDHDTIEESRRAAELAPLYGLVGIPGVEVSTRDGHLLAIGVDERPGHGRSLASTVETVHARGGVAVVPHPFQRSRHGVRASAIEACQDRRETTVDGVEVQNAYALTGIRNTQAASFAAAHDYPRFGGSDAHTARLVGRAYTEVGVDGDVTRESVLAAMRTGRTRARGDRTPVKRYLGKYLDSARIKTTSML